MAADFDTQGILSLDYLTQLGIDHSALKTLLEESNEATGNQDTIPNYDPKNPPQKVVDAAVEAITQDNGTDKTFDAQKEAFIKDKAEFEARRDPVFEAVAHGDKEKLSKLRAALPGGDFSFLFALNAQGQTLAQVAVLNDHPKLLHALACETENMEGNTAFHTAAQNNKNDALKEMVKNDPLYVTNTNDAGLLASQMPGASHEAVEILHKAERECAFFDAIKNNDADAMRTRLQDHPELLQATQYVDDSPVSIAARYHSPDALKVIFAKDPSLVNSKGAGYRTNDNLLHIAVEMTSYDNKDRIQATVDALLEAKPELAREKNSDGHTAAEQIEADKSNSKTYSLAVSQETVDSIKAVALKLDRKDFFTAVTEGKTDQVKGLLAHKPDLAKAVDEHGKTALHIAAENGYKEIAEALIAENPKLVNAKDHNGKTPRDLASELPDGDKNPEMVTLLRNTENKLDAVKLALTPAASQTMELKIPSRDITPDDKVAYELEKLTGGTHALALGDGGKGVELVQQFLKLDVTGHYDAKTKVAIEKYQDDNGLGKDGIVGKETLAKMMHGGFDAEKLAAEVAAIPPEKRQHHLQYIVHNRNEYMEKQAHDKEFAELTRGHGKLDIGAVGTNVAAFQQYLNEEREKSDLPLIAVNGKYDAQTKLAVSEYQDSHGLKKDGVVGKETFASMKQAINGFDLQKERVAVLDNKDVDQTKLIAMDHAMDGFKKTHEESQSAIAHHSKPSSSKIADRGVENVKPNDIIRGSLTESGLRIDENGAKR